MRKLSYLLVVLTAMVSLLVGGCGEKDMSLNPAIFGASGKFVYVNNDAGANYVSAFAINGDGTLAELADSPYLTGGASASNYYAANTIALARTKNLLFASNRADSTVSVFAVNANTGALTAIGAPVASGGTLAASGSLAVDADENYLFVANDGSNAIGVFAIAADGTLTAVAGSPFDIGVATDGMALNLVGSVLYVAAPNSNAIVALDVAADGSLSPIAGSPFAYGGANVVTSVAVASSTVGVAGATGGEITSYLLDAAGVPTQVDTQTVGTNQQCVSLAADGALAILSGGASGGSNIYVFGVAADATLTQVAGSPFATTAAPSGYAVATPNSSFLYATEVDQIEAFGMDGTGVLTSLGVYPLTNPGYATGLTIY